MKRLKTTRQYCLEEDDQAYAIYNPNWTEFDIHWRLECRIAAMLGLGFTVKNEVTLRIGKTSTRIDIMVFKNKQPICGVEVKRNENSTNPVQYKRQLSFYQEFHKATSIPIYYCRSFGEIKGVAHRIHNYMRDNYRMKSCNGGAE